MDTCFLLLTFLWRETLSGFLLMNDLIHARENKLATILFGVVCWLFLISLTVADPDLWGHTLYGIRAIEQGVLAERTDPFSYTAGGDPWFNHEWATEYEFGWLWLNLGNTGLVAWKVGLLSVMMIWLIRQLCRSDSNLGTRVMLLGFTTLCLGNFVVYIRPQLVTFLFFPIYLAILHQAWEKWSNAVWWLPPLMVVWVNHHGGFLAGLALTGFYAVLAWGRVLYNRSQMSIAVRLTGVCGASVLATVVNPFGIGLHQMLWIHLGTRQLVREWQSIWEVGFSWVYATPFLLLVYAFALSRRWRWIDLLVMAVVAVQAVSHLRHIALLCLAEVILLPPILSDSVRRTFPRICQQWGAPDSKRLRWGAMSVAVGFLVMLQLRGAISLWKSGIAPWEIAVETTSGAPGMPAAAVRYLNDHNLAGNIVTDYGWAQFVIWQTFPESRIGFDGRYRTVYGRELEADFLAFQMSGREMPEQTPFLDHHPTQIALLPSESSAAAYLESREDWIRVYSDGQAKIFLSLMSFHRDRIAGLQLDLPKKSRLQWEIFPTDGRTGTEIARD